MEKIIATCGNAEVYILYEYTASNTCTITEYGINLKGEKGKVVFDKIVLPSTIDGRPVISISNPNNDFVEHYAYINKNNQPGIVLFMEDHQRVTIKTLVLPSMMKSIMNRSFQNSIYVKKIIWPKTCPVIPSQCFAGSNIEEIDIPEGVTEIGDSCFQGSKLKTIKLPSSCTKIGYRAFSMCRELESVEVDKNTKEIGKEAFSFTNFSSFIWPESCEIVKSKTFLNCYHLETLKITGGIKELESQFIFNCHRLQTLDLSGIIDICTVPLNFFNSQEEVIISNIIFPIYGILEEKYE